MYNKVHFLESFVQKKISIDGYLILISMCFCLFLQFASILSYSLILTMLSFPHFSLRTSIIVENIGGKYAGDAIGTADVYDIKYRY